MINFKVTTTVEIDEKTVAFQTTRHVSKEKTIIELGVAVAEHQLAVNSDSFVDHYLGRPPAPGVVRVTVDPDV